MARKPRHSRRRAQRWTVALAAAVVACAAVVGVVTVATGSTETELPPRPTGLTDCRPDPLAHVHDPRRLKLLSDCAAVKGRIRSIRLNGGYNDVKVTVQVAGRYLRYLKPANHGLVLVDVIATDLATVTLPAVGSGATFYGAWVVDKATKAVALHPTWRVVPGEPTAKVRPAGAAAQQPNVEARPLHQGQTLAIALNEPAAIAVGKPFVAGVKAEWVKQQTSRSTGAGQAPAQSREVRVAASQVRLFHEVTTVTGKGIRWRARTTNTRGTATAQLLATFVPGRYQLTVYAYADGQTARASSVFIVKGR